MNKKILLIFSFMFLISLNFVSSVPPVTTIQEFPEGYLINEQQIHTFEFGEPLRYGFLLGNSTNGKIINDSNINYCRIITSNSQGFNTQISNLTFNETYRLWGVELNETEVLRHFPKSSKYNYAVSCQNDNGALLTGIFEVKEKEDIFNWDFSNNIYIYLLIFITILIFILIYFNLNLWGGFLGLITGVILFASDIPIIAGLIYLLGGFMLIFND